MNIDKDGGDIAFITYEKGEAEAKIRFKTEGSAKAPAAAWMAKDKVEIKGMTVVGFLLEGEEEDQFLKDSAQDLKNRRNKNKVGPQSLLCPNIYSRSRDRSLVKSAKAVGTTVTGARGGGDRC